MAYVNTKEMLLKAQKGGYAIGAFNAENMEFVQAIIAAAEEMNSPVIIQTTPGSIRYATIEEFSAMVRALAKNSKVDIALHLDHGENNELVKRCIEENYSSVMIDGSKLPFKTNIEWAQVAVEMAHKNNVTVEAELGTLGGKEDDLSSNGSQYTDPEDVKEFVKETNVDSLAVAIGTAHGVYKVAPVLDVERLSDIRKVTDTPLVLHGASGLSDESVIECVKRGICKVNFATELRQAFTKAVKEYLEKDPNVVDVKKYLKEAREAVKEQVKRRIKILGSENKN